MNCCLCWQSQQEWKESAKQEGKEGGLGIMSIGNRMMLRGEEEKALQNNPVLMALLEPDASKEDCAGVQEVGTTMSHECGMSILPRDGNVHAASWSEFRCTAPACKLKTKHVQYKWGNTEILVAGSTFVHSSVLSVSVIYVYVHYLASCNSVVDDRGVKQEVVAVSSKSDQRLTSFNNEWCSARVIKQQSVQVQ